MRRRAKKPPQFQKLHSVDTPTPVDPPLSSERKPSRWTIRRNRLAREAARVCDCPAQGLPMPCAGHQHKVEVAERFHYLEHRRRHLEAVPDYDAGWKRPIPETATAVYALVRDFVPPLDQIHQDPLTATQLVTVALDVAVVSGRYGHRVEERGDDAAARLRQIRRAVTRNTLADAVMRRWSDHARLAREEKRAFAITHMTETTARNCWRDLLVQDIHLPVLWELVTTDTPLFRAKPSRFDVSREAGAGTVVGYDITLRRSPELHKFERLVRRDRVYGPSRISHTWRIWVVGKRRPIVDTPAPIRAERKYNQVVIGDKTREVLKLQEKARLVFDARSFVEDYRAIRKEWRRVRRELREKFPTKTWPRSPEEHKLRTTQIKLQAFVWEYRSVYEQAWRLRKRKLPGTLGVGMIPIRSAFYKVLNRRYQPAHFWLTQVTGRKDKIATDLVAEMAERMSRYTLAWVGSPRRRWFTAPPSPLQRRGSLATMDISAWRLVSMDISASQTQIQAILLGDDAMEQDAVLSRRPHKIVLAERAWADHEAEDRPAVSEAERALALRAEKLLYYREAKRIRTDLVENHEAALRLNALHEEGVERIKRQFVDGLDPLLVEYEGVKDPHLIEAMAVQLGKAPEPLAH